MSWKPAVVNDCFSEWIISIFASVIVWIGKSFDVARAFVFEKRNRAAISVLRG